MAIASLRQQNLPPHVDLGIVLLDDGSTDGTSQAVSEQFPEVIVIEGDGSLYWAGGMRLAVEEAHRLGTDAILWLNDDVRLTSDAVSNLLHAQAQSAEPASIVVGAVASPHSHAVAYGGLVRGPWWAPLHFSRMAISDVPRSVDSFEGNCVLIPGPVDHALGGIDPVFTHRIADVDYGLRATAHGFDVIQAPGTVGICPRDTDYHPWLREGITARERVAHLWGPKGLPPRAWLRYARRHGGALWPYAALRPYAAGLLAAAGCKWVREHK